MDKGSSDVNTRAMTRHGEEGVERSDDAWLPDEVKARMAEREGNPNGFTSICQAAGWRAGYARVARDVPGLPERDLEAVLATVRRFLDPVLDGTASGTWDPRPLTWSG